jgi:hypothetical protein
MTNHSLRDHSNSPEIGFCFPCSSSTFNKKLTSSYSMYEYIYFDPGFFFFFFFGCFFGLVFLPFQQYHSIIDMNNMSTVVELYTLGHKNKHSLHNHYVTLIGLSLQTFAQKDNDRLCFDEKKKASSAPRNRNSLPVSRLFITTCKRQTKTLNNVSKNNSVSYKEKYFVCMFK